MLFFIKAYIFTFLFIYLFILDLAEMRRPKRSQECFVQQAAVAVVSRWAAQAWQSETKNTFSFVFPDFSSAPTSPPPSTHSLNFCI